MATEENAPRSRPLEAPQPGAGPSAAASAAPAEHETPLDFPVVGIGASAGGLEALQAMVRRLTNDSMCFVVVQHLSPLHESLLTEILGRSTAMQVTTVQDGETPQRNRIYVAPASAELEMKGGRFQLKHLEHMVPRLPIDAFLRSLAHDMRSRAIGVVLSGGGTDGTLGLQAIKSEGGITFVQDPGTAIHPNMPQSALDAGAADLSLAPEAIATELMRVSSHPYITACHEPPKRLGGHEGDGLAKIFSLLRAAFRVDFTQYKRSTLERRIERRMAVHRLDQLEAYLKYLDQNPGELDALYRDMLIGVTSFFRDREVFDAIKTTILPRIFDRRPSDAPVRFWVAGCSTGEEAYSLAIATLEQLGDRVANYKIQIFATDLDEDAIRQARHGLYRRNIELDVSPERLQRFFARRDDEYRISRQIRDMVVFAAQDLSRDPPFSRLDLVCCRNVLIYMQPPLQKKVLRIFHYALNPEGFLVLGNSESVGEVSDLFSIVDRRLKVFVKKNSPASAVFDFAFQGGAQSPARAERSGAQEPRPMLSLQQIADRKVMERFAPPGVVISEALDVLQFRGRTGAYLEPAPGAATLNILKLARPELLIELRTTIHKALSEGYGATSPPIHFKTEQGLRQLVLEAMPLQDEGVPPRCLLVLFRELPAPPSDGVAPRHGDDKQKDPRVIELERELSTTKDYLQTTIEELEASNEELKSANEELQSSNEELETSKEELQSANEELATVNEELQNRMAELSVNNDDLTNILAVVENPLILVGMDLRIRRFSHSAEKQMNLIAADFGRPVAHLRSFLDTPNIEQTVVDVIHQVTPIQQRVSSTGGQQYRMRVVPYRTADRAIRGVLIELVALEDGGAGRTEANGTSSKDRG
jgi:two-component system CheB/CheR fusion protein